MSSANAIRNADGLAAEGLEECAHAGGELGFAKVPELDGELAAEVSQDPDADPGAGEVLRAATRDDDAAAVEAG